VRVHKDASLRSDRNHVEIPSIRKEIVAFVAMSFREEEEPALVDYFRAMERVLLKQQNFLSI
jgi:hypothetical protein